MTGFRSRADVITAWQTHWQHKTQGAPMSDQPVYTFDEWRVLMARRECATHGHDFDVLQKMGGEPYMVLCGRCGQKWSVQQSNSLSVNSDQETPDDRTRAAGT